MKLAYFSCAVAAIALVSIGAVQGAQAAPDTTGKKHPEQNAVVPPAMTVAGPARGSGPNSHGYFENMTPGGLAHGDDGEHETTHPVGGKAPLNTAHPAAGNAVQRQPATPQ